MKRKKLTAALCAAAILIIILDSRSAMAGASEGIALCLQTVIPSLFPLMVLSMLLCSNLYGFHMKSLRLVGRLCKIPDGYECLLIPAFLGGYPVGAQAVSEAYRDGHLSKNTARRLLCFCSNAGTSFLFGIIGPQFDWAAPVWALWILHIVSALTVGMLLPATDLDEGCPRQTEAMDPTTALKRSIAVMAEICGWIILFRVIIRFMDNSFLQWLPAQLRTVIIGILELSNGCCQLHLIQEPGLRFIAASGLLSLGGICVMMQTAAVTKDLGIGSYLRGKLLQTVLSLTLAALVQKFLIPVLIIIPVILTICLIILRQKVKNSSFPASIGV